MMKSCLALIMGLRKTGKRSLSLEGRLGGVLEGYSGDLERVTLGNESVSPGRQAGALVSISQVRHTQVLISALTFLLL